MHLTDFHVIRPEREMLQEDTLEWIADAHAAAESFKNGWQLDEVEHQNFRTEIKDRLFSIGSNFDKIQKRGVVTSDVFHRNWEEMRIYNLKKAQEGFGFKERSELFDEKTTDVFEQFYANAPLPSQIIHVTCTGYVAPSPAQKLISKRKEGETTLVTHAYHMGCYGSIPALRMAEGFLHTLPSPAKSSCVDIVHTELSSLHMNPSLHDIANLVIQTLFADGFIKYSLAKEPSNKSSSLKLLALHEEILPDTTGSMTWKCHDWGLSMHISKEVPILISRALQGFMARLAKRSGLEVEKLKETALFAVHPGGPKILDLVSKVLELKPHQMEHSKKILREYGNMSSATLPHIWQEMLRDGSILDKTPIIGLAFGPGLNMAGAIFEKRCQ